MKRDEILNKYLSQSSSQPSPGFHLEECFDQVVSACFQDLIHFHPVELLHGRNVFKVEDSEGELFVLRAGAATVPVRECPILREVEVLEGLKHPNIVSLYQHNVIQSIRYLIKPWIEGQTWERTEQTATESLATAIVLLDALQYLHEKGYVHRDIKPENVIIDGDKVTLIDFDCAEAIGSCLGPVRGTPCYWSPEQVSREPALATADIYSVGRCLARKLTGRRYAMNEELELGDLDRKLGAIIRKATDMNPGNRYWNAEQMQADIQLLVEGKTPKAYKLESRAFTRRAAIGTIAAGALVGAGGLLFSQFSGKPETIPTKTVSLETNPVGSRVFIFPLDETGEPIKERGIDAGESPIEVDLEPGEYWITVVAPDGRWIEVIRTVPREGQLPTLYRSCSWGGILDENGKVKEKIAPASHLVLPPIKVVEPDTSKMLIHKFGWIDEHTTETDEWGIGYFNALELCERYGCILATADELQGFDRPTSEWTRTTTGKIRRFASGRMVGRDHIVLDKHGTVQLTRGLRRKLVFRKWRKSNPTIVRGSE